jgi:TrmH family RNA methyltransferase
MIVSADNNLFRHLKKLEDKKYRDREKRFLVFGADELRLARRNRLIDRYVRTAISPQNGDDIVISEQLYKKFGQSHRSDIGAVCHFAEKEFEYAKKILLLDGIQDPKNYGSLIRSALGFDFGIISSADSCNIYHDEVIYSSKGYVFSANIKDKCDLAEELKILKNLGYRIIGTILQKNDLAAYRPNVTDKIALVLGNEGHGLSSELRRHLDFNYLIPHSQIDSLNVAVAGSLLMYELSKESL